MDPEQCSRQNVQTPYVWRHICQGEPRCGWCGRPAALSASGTNGLVILHVPLRTAGWPPLPGHSLVALLACSMLGQLAWLAAILEKEMPAAGCMSATPAATPAAAPAASPESEGGEDFCLPPHRVAT
jgi:hypothetical protein